jgi:hypothetical protein
MSPTPAESLTPQSSPEEVKKATSDCISQLMKEGGRPQEQCVAICMSQARKATGKQLKPKSTRIGGR